jgi:hypothetical protein
MKNKSIIVSFNKLLWLTTAFILAMPVNIAAQTVSVDVQELRQMQETLKKQQEQLRIQAEQIKAQTELLNNLEKKINSLQQTQAPAPQPQAAAIDAPLKAMLPLTITSKNDKLKLAVSGQLNRIVNITSDGKSTSTYFADNDNSNSRIRLDATAKVTDDLTLGARFEVAVAPDESLRVSQNSQSSGDFFDQRWAEISLQSQKFGKLSLGKGDTASNNTAEVDLSKTNVVQWAGVADIAGGMLFAETSGDHTLTTMKVSDIFNRRDGLSRQSRLRYDTPNLFGFTLAGSVVSAQRYDLALFWAGEGYGFKAAGAAAVADTKEINARLQYDGSFSILHQSTGLNLTLSGGLLGQSAQDDATNLYAKLGWIANLTSLGYTAFGIDYTLSSNLPSSNDKGYSWSAAVVQSLGRIPFDPELYLQYRVYSLDRKSGTSVADINVVTFGARLKF